MKFYKPEEYQPKAQEAFLKEKDAVLTILPNARVEHIGASSITGAISKGDLDIFVGVQADKFEEALLAIKRLGYTEQKESLRTPALCNLKKQDAALDTAIQLVANGSEFEDLLKFRDLLRSNELFLRGYNELKNNSSHLSDEEYRAVKSSYIQSILNLQTDSFQEVPTFFTKRLILKPLIQEDAPSYQKHFNDYEVIRFLSSLVPWPYPENGAAYFIENMVLPRQGRDRWCWGIFEKENGDEIIGAVDLWRIPIPENRGFWLGRKFWGKGYMTEAVAPVNDYAFSTLGFERLYFSNALGNMASRRIKEKTGAKFIGTRDTSFVDPSFTKAERWELDKKNWLAINKNIDCTMIRRARPADAYAIHVAHMKSIQEVCSKHHTSEEIHAWGNRPFKEDQRLNAINNDIVYVVEKNSTIEGYGHLKILQKDETLKGHILGLYLTPTVLGTGCGREILRRLILESKTKNAKFITLESTLTAHHFYRTMGFSENGSMSYVEISGQKIRCYPMKMILGNEIQFKLLNSAEHISLVQSIFKMTPQYFLNVSGEIADEQAGKETFEAIPPNFSYENKKVIGIYLNSDPIGVLDLLIGYPSPEKAFIGLLLISESFQKRGIGKQVYQELEKHIAANFSNVRVIRLSVVESNGAVAKFWERMGFEKTGEKKPYENKAVKSNAVLYEKKILVG